MKPRILALNIVIILAPITVCAQESADQSLKRLQQEIAQRETLDRDEDMPSDLKAQNRSVLQSRREELLRIIEARLSAVQKYLETLGSSITPDEKRFAENSVQTLTAATVSLGTHGNSQSSSGPLASEEGDRRPSKSVLSNMGSPNTGPGFSQGGRSLSFGTVKVGEEKVKGFASSGTKKVRVEIRDENGNTIQRISQSTLNNETGEFTVALESPVKKGQAVRVVEDDNKASEWVKALEDAVATTEFPEGEFSRTILGFEQIGASSAESAQKPFVDLFISNPLPPSKGAARIWGDIRLSAAPQANLELANFAASALAPALSGKANQLAQAVSLTAGFEFKLGTTKLLPGFLGDFNQMIRLSFIAGGGFTTPFSPRDTVLQFKINDAAREQFDIPEDKTTIAFVTPDRDRFLRQYFGGLRFTTQYFEKNGAPSKSFPAIFDLTIGQNEAVTQRLRGTVLRLEGFYPLPYEKAKFVYLFGSGLLRLNRANIIENPLLLEPLTTPLSFSDPKLFTTPLPQANRDSYKIGIGVDLLQLLKPKEKKL